LRIIPLLSIERPPYSIVGTRITIKPNIGLIRG
jgi:hypothetical protein